MHARRNSEGLAFFSGDLLFLGIVDAGRSGLRRGGFIDRRIICTDSLCSLGMKSLFFGESLLAEFTDDVERRLAEDLLGALVLSRWN